jgi:signal transduction histidine kinase
MQSGSIARMVFIPLILAMDAASPLRLTRPAGRQPYNAAMDLTPIDKPRSPILSPRAADAAIALGLTLLVQADGNGLLSNEGSFHGPAAAVTALFMTVPLLWRRRNPLPVFLVVFVALIATFTGDVTAHASIVWTSITALVVAAYSVGSQSRSVRLSLVLLAAVATMIAVVFPDSLPAPPEFAVPYVLLLLPWLVGHALRTRQLRADAFQERARRLEQEREFDAQMARNEERERIARELHDVVAHTVSVMVVQAGAARHVVETEPEKAVEALSAVETTGREAMAELRNLLGVLNSEDGEARLTPQPGVDQLPALVQRVRDAGLPAELQVTGTPRALAPGIDLTVYRIVQEALTNALKYAGRVRTEIALDYREDSLKVEVLDEGAGQRSQPGASPGRGLAGMRDRVALYGGTLEAGPRLGRGYAVRAWLPLSGERS